MTRDYYDRNSNLDDVVSRDGAVGATATGRETWRPNWPEEALEGMQEKMTMLGERGEKSTELCMTRKDINQLCLYTYVLFFGIV